MNMLNPDNGSKRISWKETFQQLLVEPKYAPFELSAGRIKSTLKQVDEEIINAVESSESVSSEALAFISGIIADIDALVLRKEKLQELLNHHNK